MASTAELLEEALWDAIKHPRGRGGRWRDVFHAVPEVAEHLEREAQQRELPRIERREKRLEQTEAFRRGLRRLSYMRDRGPHGDEFMFDLASELGFAGRPRKVDKATLARILQREGAIELWRGVTDEDYARQFSDGSYYAGLGFKANGIYMAVGPDAHDRAVAYAQAPPARGIASKAEAPVVMHLALHPDARTITLDEAVSRAQEATREAQRSAVGEKPDPGTTQGTPGAVRLAVATDPGRWALASGYDAILVSEKEAVILNRTAVLVEDEFEPAGENVAYRIRRVGG